jgi:hypothetical protein
MILAIHESLLFLLHLNLHHLPVPDKHPRLRQHPINIPDLIYLQKYQLHHNPSLFQNQSLYHRHYPPLLLHHLKTPRVLEPPANSVLR